MPRSYDPIRACLRVHDWPKDDQMLWARISAAGDPEDEARGAGASWRPTTLRAHRDSYGRWLNFLKRSGADLNIAAADRVTPERVKAYRQELQDQGLMPLSRSNRIAHLYRVIAAFAPDRDWTWLRRRCKRLNAITAEERRQKPITALSGDILDRALRELEVPVTDSYDRRLARAIAYRNWLMIASLSLMPLRLRNFSQLSLTQHLRCNGDVWTIKIPASEMKMGRPFTMPVPAILQRHLQYYFDRVRPALLAGLVSDRFWISFHHTAMDDHSVNGVITNFTRQVLGESINPHRFRHIGATSVVVAAPEMLEAARALLGHDNIQTTSDTYIIGSSLAACRQHGQLVSMLRDRMPEMRGACE